MSNRWFAVAAVLTLLASLAFATPSQAGSVVVTTVSYATATPGLLDLDMTYTGAGTITGLAPGVAPGGGTVTLLTPNEVQIAFAPANVGPFGPFSFSFNSTAMSGTSVTPSFNPSGVTLTNFSFGLTQNVIPEPSSMALLGIGVTGFLAFRRLFKRTRVA